METGDTVTLTTDSDFRGTILQMPRSVGRKRPRALVGFQGGERWIHVDELRPVATDSVTRE
jgi:hypothetical protein